MLTRREFLKLCMNTASGLALTSLLLPELARAFPLKPGQRKAPVVWLECDTCAGDILSLVNAADPGLEKVLFELIDLEFDQLLTTAEGGVAMAAVDQVAAERRGEFILIIEGTLPADEYATITARNGQPISARQAARELAAAARYTIAAGSCAAWGSIYTAKPNPTDGKPASYVVPNDRLINVPGCPVHPDWLIGTLTHVLLYGVPDLDRYRRPKMFFGRTVHELCPRRAQYERSQYAKNPGDDGCYYKIGCKGPVTEADCPTREWNGRRNWPIGANTPCIGCTSHEWPQYTGPFFQHLPDVTVGGRQFTANQVSGIASAVTAGAIALHFAGTALSGRLRKNWENPGGNTETAPAKKRARRTPRSSKKVKPRDDKGGSGER